MLHTLVIHLQNPPVVTLVYILTCSKSKIKIVITSSFVKIARSSGDTAGTITFQRWSELLPKLKPRLSLDVEGPTRLYDREQEGMTRLPDYQSSFNIPKEGDRVDIEMPRDNGLFKLRINVEAESECGIMFSFTTSTMAANDDDNGNFKNCLFYL